VCTASTIRIGNARPMRRDAIGPRNNVSRPANRASPALRIVDLLRSVLETDSLSANADGETEPAGACATSPYSPSGIVDSFTGSGLQQKLLAEGLRTCAQARSAETLHQFGTLARR